MIPKNSKNLKKPVPLWFAICVIAGVTAIFGALFLHYFLLMPDVNFDLYL